MATAVATAPEIMVVATAVIIGKIMVVATAVTMVVVTLSLPLILLNLLVQKDEIEVMEMLPHLEYESGRIRRRRGVSNNENTPTKIVSNLILLI